MQINVLRPVSLPAQDAAYDELLKLGELLYELLKPFGEVIESIDLSYDWRSETHAYYRYALILKSGEPSSESSDILDFSDPYYLEQSSVILIDDNGRVTKKRHTVHLAEHVVNHFLDQLKKNLHSQIYKLDTVDSVS